MDLTSKWVKIVWWIAGLCITIFLIIWGIGKWKIWRGGNKVG